MQSARVASLRGAGATDDEIAALHCPTGLDLGARTPAESAVSIMAEIIAVRSGRDAQPFAHEHEPDQLVSAVTVLVETTEVMLGVQ